MRYHAERGNEGVWGSLPRSARLLVSNRAASWHVFLKILQVLIIVRKNGDPAFSQSRRRTQTRLHFRRLAHQFRYRLIVLGNYDFFTRN